MPGPCDEQEADEEDDDDYEDDGAEQPGDDNIGEYSDVSSLSAGVPASSAGVAWRSESHSEIP